MAMGFSILWPPSKVLAVMCHPNSRVGRERMLGNIQKETGTGKPRRKPLSSEEFRAEVRRVGRRAGLSLVGLVLTLIQLNANGYGGSLNQALPLIADLLPKWQNPSRVPYSVQDLSLRASSPQQGEDAAGLSRL